MSTTHTKEKSFTFTLTKEEHQRMLAVAVADGTSAADWIRQAINRRFEELDLEIEPPRLRR